MADTKSVFDWILADHVSGPAKKMEGALGKASGAAGGGAGPFGKLGSAIGSMINPTTLAIGAVGALTAGIGDSLKKAAEHQVVSERLNAVLKANVQGYNGNRDAIDSYIAKQMDLGFTVDETTAAYAQLVGATHDTRKGQEFLTAAQDLARLKGISLADATDAMTKVEAGRYRGLQTLGIVLKAGATQEEALAAVRRVAAGQAAAYADTAAGHIAQLSAKWDDLMTKAGETVADLGNKFAGFVLDTVLPDVAIAQKATADWLTGLLDGVTGFAETVAKLHPFGMFQPQTGPMPSTGITRSVPSGSTAYGHGAGQSTLDAMLSGSQYTPQGFVSGGQTLVPQKLTTILQIDGKQVAQVVDQHLYYMLRGSPATRMRN